MEKKSTRLTRLFIVVLLCTAKLAAQPVTCDSTSNVIIYSNYDGGALNINVDQNIPNLMIGVVSYEAVQINITGTYAGNVTKVWYAGYNGGNDHCNLGITNTTINGVPANVDTIEIIPAATYSDPNGYASMVCSYQCVTGNQGGCNTPEQVVHFFMTKFGVSTFRFHRTQYGCWPTVAPVSSGGNCCLAPLSSGSNELQVKNSMNLFPNPTSGAVQLEYFSTTSEVVDVAMFDATGSLVMKQNLIAVVGENKITLEIEDLASGMYLIQVTSTDGIVCEHLIIE